MKIRGHCMTNSIDKTKLGRAIRKARENRNLTQEKLAERINKSSKTVANYERGKFVPSEAVLERLANALEYSIDEIASGELNSEPLRA